MIELIYTEHQAGEFEDGLQVCKLCGMVITDWTGHWAVAGGLPPGEKYPSRGFPQGPLYISEGNPKQYMTVKPEENYGGDDPYKRVVKPCTEIKK